ncbi:MAG: hypothetical protein J7619_00030 [Dyadobacter sp.]|uniref:hypothetical protein n=1 Tax=Dyadobacter sp. TaxID=1914288 RepID=UPI001B2E325D|nr:hypothetical protein [Dyadobacter sp.]MBO9611044.1 hypothetical protein [Dyadobacter sp.]
MTWEDWRSIAMGELGLTYQEFYDKTLFELSAEYWGYIVRNNDAVRPIRKLYTLLHNIHAKHTRTEQKLWPLPYESQQQAAEEREMSPEEKAARKAARNAEFKELLEEARKRKAKR